MSHSPNIKITDVKVVPLKMKENIGTLEPAWDKGGKMNFSRGGGAFTQVETDAGITGIGPNMDPGILGPVKNVVLGNNPFDIQHISKQLKYFVYIPSKS